MDKLPTSMVGSFLGTWTQEAIEDVAQGVPPSTPPTSAPNTKLIKPYNPARPNPFDPPFDPVKDFQVGSVILPVPPNTVEVRRVRDVLVTPILRGQAVPVKAGQGLLTIDFSVDFPAFYDRDTAGTTQSVGSALTRIIAELKTCPFTVLRSRDLASKVTQRDPLGLPENTQRALLNIARFGGVEQQLRNLLSNFRVRRTQLGADVDAKWQTAFWLAVDAMIKGIATFDATPGWDEKYVDSPGVVKAIETYNNFPEPIRTAALTGFLGNSKANAFYTELRGIFRGGVNATVGGRDNFGPDLWDKWDALWNQAEFRLIFTRLFQRLVQAAVAQRDVNNAASGADTHATVPPAPEYIPVAFQRMVLNTIPGKPGRVRVDFSFELFNHTVYTKEFLWHSARSGKWGTTDNPAEADLLLRWRDTQYLEPRGQGPHGYYDMGGVSLKTLNESTKLPVGSSDLMLGDSIPGYLNYMRAAWKNRRGRIPSVDPEKHGLKIFYPESTPQIPSALAASGGTFYRELVLDDPAHRDEPDDSAEHANIGITQAVQIVWQVGMARQTDEYTGIVNHQFVGGSNMQVKFDIVIPTRDGRQHEQLLGEINRMYNVLEQNRRLLPSESWMPTTLFVRHQLTEMMGAWCFEATDLPLVQDGPGKISLAFQLVEALPVVGLGQAIPEKKIPSVEESWALLMALWDYGPYRTAVIDAIKDSVELQPQPDKRTENLARVVGKLLSNMPLGSIYTHANSLGLSPWGTGGISNLQPIDYDYFNIDWTSFYSTYGPAFGLPARTPAAEPLKSDVNLYACMKLLALRLIHSTQATQYPFHTFSKNDNSPGNPITVVERLVRHSGHLQADGKRAKQRESVFRYMIAADKVREAAWEALKDTVAYVELRNGKDYGWLKNLVDNDVPAATSKENLLGYFSLDHTEILSQAVRPMTAQLYPDLALPTYRELFQIGPEVSDDNAQLQKDLAWFVPSWAELGIVQANEAIQLNPGRRLDDIADPDVWFRREVPPEYLPGTGSTVKGGFGDPNAVYVESPDTPPGTSGQSKTPNDKITTGVLENTSDQGIATVDNVQTYRNLEEQYKPNTRRLLFAFPTYNLEFVLEATSYKSIEESIDPPFHYQARLFNVLPVTSLLVYEDTIKPCRAEVEFIGRRAALRNEAWGWIPPRIPHESPTSTNNIARFKAYLQTRGAQSDPTMITRILMSEGTRVIVRMGYGTDLNNDRMLPVKIAGTIGEVTLGEQSSMLVQSLGTQLWNPINTEIGGHGYFSPNRIWSGKYTMRAFGDIMAALDTRWLGRSGSGLENDLPQLTDEDIKRLYNNMANTRSTVETVSKTLADFWGRAQGVFQGAKWQNSVANLMHDVAADFRPELLNVYPIATAISDWAISNTDTHHLPANYWIDMMARLNPGAIWWTHPFGDEARLFYGRPDQVYRETPLPVDGARITSLVAGMSQTQPSLSGIAGQVRDDFLGLHGHIGDPTQSTQPNFNHYAQWFRVAVRAAKANVPILPDPMRPDPVGVVVDNYRRALHSYYAAGDSSSGLGKLEALVGTEPTALLRDLMVADLELQSTLINNTGDLFGNIYGEDAKRYLQSQIVQVLLVDKNFKEAFNSDESFMGWFRSAVESVEGENIQIPGSVRYELLVPDVRIRIKYKVDSAEILTSSAHRVGKMLAQVLAVKNAKYASNLTSYATWNAALARLRWALGYRRFRRTHIALSGTNIIANQIAATQAHMANAVDVDKVIIGYNVLPQERRVVSLEGDLDKLNFGIFQWAKGLIGENDKDGVLGMLIPTALAEGMSRMYEGELILRGDPWIKPHDLIYILDLHNGLYGPIKARTVIHSLDATSGMITRVGVAMHTQAHSSRALIEHVVLQRQLKTAAAVTAVAGTAALFIPGGGLVIGGLILFGGAGLAAYAELRDSVGQAHLQNFSVGDALAGDVSHASNRRLMEALLLDNFIGSDSLKAISPVAETELNIVRRMKDPTTRQLGVTIFPLIKLGSGAPLVAGLTSGGIADIDESPRSISAQSFDNIKEAWSALQMVVNGEISDVQAGTNAILNTITSRIALSARNAAALEARIPGITQQ